MSERKFKTVHRHLTAQERERHRLIRQGVERDKPDLTRKATVKKLELDELHRVLALLKQERQRRELSLSALATRSGIDKSRLSRLENDPFPNVTLETLLRLARAIGVKLTIAVAAA